VRATVRGALKHGVDSEAIADWLTAIDWGGVESADPSVREIVGLVELWSTEYAEGDLTAAEYADRLSRVRVNPSKQYSPLPSAS